MSLAFIPVYIKFMGIEAYGLIGIFVSLMALLSVLDMGLSSTLSRELARLFASGDTEQESRDIVRTLEYVYWSVGILIASGLIVSAPYMARHWISTQAVPIQTVQQALMIMGLVVAFQWPASFYDGGLMGLQRQVLLNGVRGVMATIQHAGAVLVLWLVSPSILAYFTWQIIVSMVQTVLLARSVWTSLPAASGKSSFRIDLMKKNLRFAMGLTSISILSVVLTQTDKIILSKLLTLTAFGYYTLAFNLANSLSQLVLPILLALFPRLSQLALHKEREADIAALYHSGCQLVSTIVLPAAFVVTFFSENIMLLWVHDQAIAQHTHLLLSLLIAGSTLNSLMLLPLTLQLSYGWTKLSFFKNIVAVILYIPLLLWLVSRAGAIGAAVVWILLNAGYFLMEIPIMHTRLLKNEMWRWYFKDVGVPVLIVASVAGLSRILLPQDGSSLFIFGWIVVTGLSALFFTAMTFPFTYEWLRRAKNT